MRLHNLDLNLLIVLNILLEEQSVSQTAQRLNMTQPAISNVLARLRAHFDDELFVVMGRRMAPTPLCLSLAEPVKKVIEELRAIAATRATFDPKTSDRVVTIVCSDYVFLVFLSGVIRRLSVDAPNLRIRTLLTDEHTGEHLKGGRADFSVVPMQRMVEGLPHVTLFSDEHSVIAWRDNSLLGKTLSKDQYLSLEHVSTSIGPNTPPHVEQESLERQGMTRKIAVYAPNFTSMAEVVVGTNYIATVQSRSARILSERLPLRVFKPPAPIADFSEILQWSPSRAADPGVIWLKEYLIASGAQM